MQRRPLHCQPERKPLRPFRRPGGAPVGGGGGPVPPSLLLRPLRPVLVWRPDGQPVVDGVTQLTDDGNPKKPDRPLVSDGSRIYFNEMQGSSEVLAQVAATGGQTGTLASGIESPMLGISCPDSSSLLLANSHRQDWFLLHWFLFPYLPASHGDCRNLTDSLEPASPRAEISIYQREGRCMLGQRTPQPS